MAVIFGRELSSLHFPVLYISKTTPNHYCRRIIFRTLNEMCSGEIHSLVPQFLTDPAKTRHSTHIVEKNRHFFRIPSVRIKFHLQSESLFCSTAAQEDASPIATILTCSILELTVIFLAYPHKRNYITVAKALVLD